MLAYLNVAQPILINLNLTLSSGEKAEVTMLSSDDKCLRGLIQPRAY